ncbi:MAG: FAD-dependent oxidoreductase [Desulfobulbaceae bacterium]|nr:FAD-dependent oxidoreductase [Desulfobulbaceae bacterium]
MNRRDFLKTLAAVACLPACSSNTHAFPQGELLGVSDGLGHRLRDGGFPAPTSRRRTTVVIVGAGIAGLSAAWALERAGMHDFIIVELEAEAGGNARAGSNIVTGYPWGAHYLPIPTQESRATRIMLAEFGILQGEAGDPRPRYDELTLCHAPQERLYINGYWQEGLMPRAGIPRGDLEQLSRFEELLQRFRQRRDGEGRKAFAIPMELSSREVDLLALDRISFTDFLHQHGFSSPSLHWYVDYCCRDDFGCGAAQTSAWAGMHYFCCRDGEAANAATDSVLTWPEGNAWLARRLAAKAGSRIQTGAVAFHLEEQSNTIALEVYLAREGRSERLQANQLIWASQLFQLPRVQPSLPTGIKNALGQFSYAPWLTANLSLRAPMAEAPIGAPLAWDNVLYGTESLGYVVANHQHMRITPEPTVLTYYRSLARDTPSAGRQRLTTTPWRSWAEMILRELSIPHRDLAKLVQRIDVWRNGHAMVRPAVGFIWGEARQSLLRQGKHLHLAHSDLSGFSLFEEAQYRGIAAAEQVLRTLAIRHDTMLF